MNISQSIFTAPINRPSGNREQSGRTSPDIGLRSASLRIPDVDSLQSIDERNITPTSAASLTARVLQTSHWQVERRTELAQNFSEGLPSAGTKRTSSRVSPNLSTASGPPSPKRLNRQSRFRQELHWSVSAQHNPSERSPPGPLFFSNQPSHRPSLPYRLSSSEAGAKMLSKANKEDSGGVRTLKLARGSAGANSPSRPSGPRTPSGSGRSYLSTGGKSKSPEDRSSSHGASILNQVGVAELLDQDDRPTFVLDLSDRLNFEPGPLKILFANASLRAVRPILDIIIGIAARESPGISTITATTAFSDFKAWATSYVKDNEPLDVTLPSFFYAGCSWTSCSLRKRFRVIRGTPDSAGSANAAHTSNPPSAGLSSRALTENEHGGPHHMKLDRLGATKEESQDYFGNAKLPSPKDDRHMFIASDAMSQKVPRIGIPTRNRGTPPQSGSSGTSPLVSRENEAILRAASAGDLDHFAIPESGFFDWTRLSPNEPTLSGHTKFARSIDWRSTSLGPIELWPSELRSMCNLIMASPHPAAMYWGPDLIAIYNEAYVLLAGQKHPQLMGQSYREAWPEIWDTVRPVFHSATTTGQSTMKDDDCLFIQRASEPGHLEETYFSWSIIPLVGADGSVVGLYNPAFEKTRRKVAERRMLTLREVGEKTASARDLKSFWQQCLKGLEYNEFDSPFVLLYSVGDEPDSDSSSIHSNSNFAVKQCVLEGSLGVPQGHPAAANIVDLNSRTEYFSQVFREAIKSDQPILLSVADGSLDPVMLEGIEERGFGDPCNAAVCCPVHLTGGESTLGFLVIGVNPRRPYDDDYSLYVQLLSRQIATAMASVVLFEEEIARGRRAARLAAQDRIHLSEQLAARTQEAVASETKFTRFAEFAPVGIFIADSSGYLTYVNEKWYEISKVPKGLEGTGWMDSIKDEDQATVKVLWAELVQNAVAMNAEIRFKRTWVDRNGDKGDTWVLASAYPEVGDDGKVKVIFGSITDISQQKWAEYSEKRRVEEAVEMKRQQENFIDITSHEMRNPLSAILQCADEISTTMTDMQDHGSPQDPNNELVKNAIDAAGTIILCAQHQKRIVDDILTLSKLDSALLLVTPCDAMPQTVVQRALKMFDGEVHAAGIDLNFKIDSSIERLGIEWVRLDPSRLLQVLINLTTNAIKFTTTQEERIINVTFAATLEQPSQDTSVVSYFPTRSKRNDLTRSAEWGTGDELYLQFSVQDTGRGLSDDEKKLLFIRFSQASPRTHVQYGGSGLGLFISRELVELQGGEIGVVSEAGKGSTFAFYIKARRSSAPKDGMDQFPGAGTRKQSAGRNSLSTNIKAPIQSSRALQTTQPGLPKEPRPKNDLKILIVEDNLVNQKVLSKQLRNMGCIVHVANHGGECLDRLRASTFWKGKKGNRDDDLEISVILMDQEMPIMDGLTCTKEIRKLEAKGDVVAHVPIVAVTANARSEQIDTALNVGMDDVVSKPFRISDLIPKVEELMARYPHPAKQR